MALIPTHTFPTAYIPTNNLTAETIRLPEGSLNTHISVLDNLMTANGKVLEWTGDMRLKTAGDVVIDAIPSANAPYPNVLAYDPASNKLFYQGDYTGTIKGINAGSNIAVETTNAALPTVRLQDDVSVATVEASAITSPVLYTEEIALPPTSDTDTITVGPLACLTAPLYNSHLTNKLYVDEAIQIAMPTIVATGGVVATTDNNTTTVELASVRDQTIAVNNPKNLLVDIKGRVISCGNGSDPITSLTPGNGIEVTPGPTPTVSLGQVGTAATYNYVRSMVVDAYGRVVAGQTGTAPVTSVGGGPGMAVDNTNPQAPIVRNTGLLSLSAGEGIALDIITSAQAPAVRNTGVLSLTGGAGITVTKSGGAYTVVNAGVKQVVQGTGIALTGTSDTPTVGLATTNSQGTYTNPSSVSVDLFGRVVSATSGPTPVTDVVAGSGIQVATSGTTKTVSLQYPPMYSFSISNSATTLNTTTFTSLQDFALTNFPVYSPPSGTSMTYNVSICLTVRPAALQAITQDLQAYLTLVWPNGTELTAYPGGSSTEPIYLNTSPYSSLARAVISWNTTIANSQQIQYPMKDCKLRLYLRSVGANQSISGIWFIPTFTPVLWAP